MLYLSYKQYISIDKLMVKIAILSYFVKVFKKEHCLNWHIKFNHFAKVFYKRVFFFKRGIQNAAFLLSSSNGISHKVGLGSGNGTKSKPFFRA